MYTVESLLMARMTILEGREGIRTRTGKEENTCLIVPWWWMAFGVWVKNSVNLAMIELFTL
jgi:hypothetical protein